MSKIDISGMLYPVILIGVTLIIGAIVFASSYPLLGPNPDAPEPTAPEPPTSITAARHNHLGLWMIALFGAFRPELYKLFCKMAEMEMSK